MKNKVYILEILLFAALIVAPAAGDNQDREREQQIKAAFLYNFINFVDWSAEKLPDNDEPVVIGIIGNEDFVKAFDPIKDKQIKGKYVIVKYLSTVSGLKHSWKNNKAQFEQAADRLKKCHVVFIGSDIPASDEDPGFIVEALMGFPILMVGEHPGFLEKAGHINFLLEDNKIRFEINLSAAKKNQMKIRAQLLKLAKRVVGEEEPVEKQSR